MYLLDTNVISELRRSRPHGAVVAWLESVPDQDLHLCAATLGELQAGVEITREQDQEKASQIESWIDKVDWGSRFSIRSTPTENEPTEA